MSHIVFEPWPWDRTQRTFGCGSRHNVDFSVLPFGFSYHFLSWSVRKIMNLRFIENFIPAMFFKQIHMLSHRRLPHFLFRLSLSPRWSHFNQMFLSIWCFRIPFLQNDFFFYRLRIANGHLLPFKQPFWSWFEAIRYHRFSIKWNKIVENNVSLRREYISVETFTILFSWVRSFLFHKIVHFIDTFWIS